MATYLFTCPDTDCPGSQDVVVPMGSPLPRPVCVCGNTMVRNWRGERVSVDAAVGNIRRDELSAERRDLFLPTRQDFLKQTGGNEALATKKIAEWNEHHEPQDPKGGKFRPR